MGSREMTRPMDQLLDKAEKIRSMEIRGAALIGRARPGP